jgi:effector-binding domain-containing protein
MTQTIRLELQSATPLAVVRRRAGRHEFSRVVPEACGFVWNALRSQNISGAGRHVAVYLDDAVNLEIGVELKEPYTGDSNVLASATPAGRVATTMHLGPYENLCLTQEAVQA